MRSITATKPTISPLKLEEKTKPVLEIINCQDGNTAKKQLQQPYSLKQPFLQENRDPR